MSVERVSSTDLRFAPGGLSRPWRSWMVLALVLMVTPGIYSQTQTSGQEEIHSHFQRADVALKSGNAPLAEQEFRAILALDPNNSEARTKLGFVLFMRGDWADAAGNFQQVLKAQPQLANVQAALGMCQKRLGRPEEARKLLEEAFPCLPSGALQTQAGLELAEIQYQSGDLYAAVDVVRILLPSNPQNVDVLYTAARIYADLANRSRDALALAAPDSARPHQLMAEFLINRGDAHAAISQYRKALELEPKLRGVHYELGEAILQDSRATAALEAAEKEFRAALADNPADSRRSTGLALFAPYGGITESPLSTIREPSNSSPITPMRSRSWAPPGSKWVNWRRHWSISSLLFDWTRCIRPPTIDLAHCTANWDAKPKRAKSSKLSKSWRNRESRSTKSTNERAQACRKPILLSPTLLKNSACKLLGPPVVLVRSLSGVSGLRTRRLARVP